MKVVHVTPWFPPATRYGGPVVSVAELARAQVEAGARVTVLTTDADGDGRVGSAPLEVRDGVRVRTFRTSFPRRLFHAPGLVASLAGEVEDADVLHVHGLYHGPGWNAARAARRVGTPLVVSPRGMLVRELIARRSPLAKRAWLAAFPRDAVAAWLATSRRERADLVDLGVPEARVRVLPNGVRVPAAPAGEVRADVAEVLAGGDYVLYLGRLSWKKGLDVLLDAWRPHASTTRLVVVGPDDEGLGTALARDAGELSASGRLVRLDAVGRDDGAALLAGARVLALFSEHENFGNVVFEALAAGTPVVAHDTVGAAEWVAEAGAGWVVPRGAAAAGLSAALADADERRRRGELGRALAARWSWRRVAEETLASYPVGRATSA